MTRMTKDGVELVEGKEYVITGPGAHLSGMVPKPGYMQGWGQDLPIGSVVRYEGCHRGWGSDPLPTEDHWSTEESRAVHASFVCLKPDEGFWDSRPRAGLVRGAS